MAPEDRSRALRQEADEVLDLIGLNELVALIGPLMPTGSYFMGFDDVSRYRCQSPAHNA